MKALVKSFTIFSVLLSSVALAHEAIEIKSSTPSKNAMLMEAPMELSVSFTKGVRLIKVVLKDSEGAKVDFGFEPPKEVATDYSWTLPKLRPGSYNVEFIMLGSDGHKMKDSFGFMVH